MSPKRLQCVLFIALATSALLGSSLVWIATSYDYEFGEESDPSKLQTVALAREDRSFLANRRSVLHADPMFIPLDGSLPKNAPTLRGNSPVPSTAPRKLSSERRNVITTITSAKKEELQSGMTADCRWVNRTTPKSHFLTAVVLLRIYKEDKADLTTRELKQWLEYVRYIGVEHVYLYDAFVKEDEAQKNEIKLFLQDGFVTYVDWHVHNPYTISGTQVSAYQHCIDNFGQESVWQAAIDIDEYPFSPVDTRPGFLSRFIKNFTKLNPTASEICMQNFLFLGKPLPLELLMERIWRRTPKPANPLVKPIYKPANVRAQVHHNHIMMGHSTNAPTDQLRMNHYWGARLQNWGEDTPEIIAQTIEDRSMEDVVKEFKRCELYVRPYLR